MHFSTFGDETMHFVGAQVLLAGGILYRDFIELHGPLAYAIPQAWGALFGFKHPLQARLILVVFTLGTGAAIAAGACLRGAWERILALAVFLGLITTLWLVQSLCLYDYQPPAGALLMTGLALGVLPCWFGETPSPVALFAAGFCFGLTPFIAFSYGPPALLFLASGAWSLIAANRMAATKLHAVRPLALGVAAAGFLMAAWLLRFADLRGYLVFHFIHALADFGPYLTFGVVPSLTVLLLPARPETLAQIMGVAAGVMGFSALIAAGGAKGWRLAPLLLGLAGVIATNGRGSFGFQDAAFIVVAFGILATALAQLPRRTGRLRLPRSRLAWIAGLALLICGAEFVARHAVSSPHGYTRRALRDVTPGTLAQSDEAWARKVRRVTDPSERILAVPFWPDMYMRAGRLPIERYMYYLPWDADYARHPVLGLDRDLCADVARDPPPVIYDNNWIVWNKYDPRRYAACLSPILAKLYRPMPGEAYFYVRADRMARLKDWGK